MAIRISLFIEFNGLSSVKVAIVQVLISTSEKEIKNYLTWVLKCECSFVFIKLFSVTKVNVQHSVF